MTCHSLVCFKISLFFKKTKFTILKLFSFLNTKQTNDGVFSNMTKRLPSWDHKKYNKHWYNNRIKFICFQKLVQDQR